MNKFKHMKKILKQCIHQLDESSSLFVVNPEKDFNRKDTFNKLGYKAKINTHTTSYIN